MSHLTPFKSNNVTLVENGTFDIADFVPPRGPNGGRVVVDKFVICVQGTLTVTTTAWDGRDVPRIFTNIACFQRDGRPRWSLSGMKSRHMSISMNGIEEHEEHANVAVGAAQAIDLRLIIPMAKQKIRRGKDFALPADCFQKFTLNTNNLAGLATSTSVLSVYALSCYILAHYHEEHNVEFKSEDIVKSQDFNSNTECKIVCSGVVHDLYVVKEDTTAGSGASLAAITDARIEELGVPTLTRGDLVHFYRTKRKSTASGPTTPGTQRFLEPVQQGVALPVIAADSDTSPWDGKIVPAMTLKLGAGLAGLAAITREVVDKSQTLYNQIVALHDVDESALRVKTDGKTRRALRDGWTRRQLTVAPVSAPLTTK